MHIASQLSGGQPNDVDVDDASASAWRWQLRQQQQLQKVSLKILNYIIRKIMISSDLFSVYIKIMDHQNFDFEIVISKHTAHFMMFRIPAPRLLNYFRAQLN